MVQKKDARIVEKQHSWGVDVATINTHFSSSLLYLYCYHGSSMTYSFAIIPNLCQRPLHFTSVYSASSQPPSSSSRRHKLRITSAEPHGMMPRLPAYIHVLRGMTRSARSKSPASKATSVISSRDAWPRSSRGKSLYYHQPRRRSRG